MIEEAKKRRRKRFSQLFGLIISGVCLVWLFSSVELSLIIEQLKSADYGFIFFAVLATAFSYLVRSFRWIYFFEKPTPNFSTAFCCLIYGFFMNNVLPARMGELVRAHVGGRLMKLSRAHILATIAGERLADGLVISVIFAVCYLTSSQEIYHHQGLLYVSYLFLVISVLTGLVLWQQKIVLICLEKLSLILPGRLSQYSFRRMKRFMEGLAPLYQIKRLFLIITLSVVVWAIELFVYYLVSSAFKIDLSISALSIFLVAVNFSSLIPAAPGGIGVIEAFATFVLTKIGVPKETAFAMVASQHLIQILVVGIPGAFVQFKYFGNKIPVASAKGD